MSPRAKSWLGGLLFALGLFAFFGGALFPGLIRVAWAGAAAALAGLGLVASAVRSVSREIGANQARFEAQLRADAGPPALDKGRKENPP